MNNKIKQLAEQAGFYFYDMHDVDGQDLGETIEADSWNAAEKFAELILKDVVSILESENIMLGGHGYNQYPLHNKIKSHFGVK